ncbi:MAG TPA: sigma-54 dependent transcriptional regulator [Gemmatimonadaceae bacterium]
MIAPSKRLTILCVDDDEQIRRAIEAMLRRLGYDVTAVADVKTAVQSLGGARFDLVITDMQMPMLGGMDLLDLMRQDGDETPVLMLTGHGTIEQAVAAIKAGAANFLTKPVTLDQLALTVEQALAQSRLREENAALRREVQTHRSDHEIVGESVALLRLMESVRAAATSRATVLLQGESGTGKELLARAIHEQSDRARGPFVRINCAAMPEGLIESTLFGHERGAFTGAFKRSIGAFERADGGTLLLDEVSEMRLDLQPKLLRVLQEREFERVGGAGTITTDVRVVATTNRTLANEVSEGRFRQDLYYRLSVFPIEVPPLRDRLDDIPLLAHRFAARAAAEAKKQIDGFAPETIELLRQQPWPGNIRELQHAVERAVILATEPVLRPYLFAQFRSAPAVDDDNSLIYRSCNSAATSSGAETGAADGAGTHVFMFGGLTLADIERLVIDRALATADGNRTQAAQLLGIDVRTLRRKLNGAASPERGNLP